MKSPELAGTAAVLALFAAAAVVQGQEAAAPAPKQQQKDQRAAPKPRKVWTNDDLASSQPPADANLKSKGALSTVGAPASEDMQPKAVQAQAPPRDVPAPNIVVPQSIEEADKLVQQTTVFANDEAIALARKQKELEEAPESQKADLQKEVEMHKRYMEETRQELKAYQDKKKELEKKKNQGQGQPQTQN